MLTAGEATEPKNQIRNGSKPKYLPSCSLTERERLRKEPWSNDFAAGKFNPLKRMNLMRPRFLLDEHQIVQFRNNSTICTFRRALEMKACLRLQLPDPDNLTWIERNNYILITNNRTTDAKTSCWIICRLAGMSPEFFVSHSVPQLER